MNFDLREPSNDSEFAYYYDLRWRILREPWNQSKESERDEHEAGATHIGAWEGDVLVGVGRLHLISSQEAQIRYMAVEHGYGNKGIGSAILVELERRAREHGAIRIVLNARETAREFYSKHGYTVAGPSAVLFEQIPHSEMSKDLRRS